MGGTFRAIEITGAKTLGWEPGSVAKEQKELVS